MVAGIEMPPLQVPHPVNRRVGWAEGRGGIAYLYVITTFVGHSLSHARHRSSAVEPLLAQRRQVRLTAGFMPPLVRTTAGADPHHRVTRTRRCATVRTRCRVVPFGDAARVTLRHAVTAGHALSRSFSHRLKQCSCHQNPRMWTTHCPLFGGA